MKNHTLLKLGVMTFAVATLGVAEVAHAEEVTPTPLATATTEAPAEATAPVANTAESTATNGATVETPAANANEETAVETPAASNEATTEATVSEKPAETPKAETPANGEAFNGETTEPFINPVGGYDFGDPSEKAEGYTPIRITITTDYADGLNDVKTRNYYMLIGEKGDFKGKGYVYFKRFFEPGKGGSAGVLVKFIEGYDAGQYTEQFAGHYSEFLTNPTKPLIKLTYDLVKSGQTVFYLRFSNAAGYSFKSEDGAISVKTSTASDTEAISKIEAKVVTDESVLSKLPTSFPAKDVLLYDIKLKSWGDLLPRAKDIEKGIIAGEATVTAKVDPTRKVEKVFYFLPETGAIEELPFTLNDGSVTFKVSHFSNYGVLYADDSVKPAPTPDNGGKDNVQPTPEPAPTPTPDNGGKDNVQPTPEPIPTPTPDNGGNQTKPTDNTAKPVKPVDDSKPADKPAKKDSKDSTEPAKSDKAEKPATKNAEPAKTEAAKSADQAKPADKEKTSLPNTGESSSYLAGMGLLLASLGLAGWFYKGRHER
ncbi:hypothetical protein STRDD10_01852 [Streptococcus sp. DD10]|uniref:LPXTG cell wall anchor domain-containing protein n=1 Tax=Streptococcus sp. DD10 TaxID=1777878 RepID=UPI0007962902|nr:LPXTG cell wall anchor domain-containing protein [Streptococcus sp. DD10]KXT72548.1 hypothetical protein STRDD10_01852 [Streptococcus sp. DD10]